MTSIIILQKKCYMLRFMTREKYIVLDCTLFQKKLQLKQESISIMNVRENEP